MIACCSASAKVNGFLQIRGSYVPLRPGTFVIINAGEPYNVIAYVGERLIGYRIHFDYSQNHGDVVRCLSPVRVAQLNKKTAAGGFVAGGAARAVAISLRSQYAADR